MTQIGSDSLFVSLLQTRYTSSLFAVSLQSILHSHTWFFDPPVLSDNTHSLSLLFFFQLISLWIFRLGTHHSRQKRYAEKQPPFDFILAVDPRS